jgi:hypothetical protein
MRVTDLARTTMYSKVCEIEARFDVYFINTFEVGGTCGTNGVEEERV